MRVGIGQLVRLLRNIAKHLVIPSIGKDGDDQVVTRRQIQRLSGLAAFALARLEQAGLGIDREKVHVGARRLGFHGNFHSRPAGRSAEKCKPRECQTRQDHANQRRGEGMPANP